MSRKKKNVEIVEEVIEPMKEDAKNPPVEEDKAEEVSASNEEAVVEAPANEPEEVKPVAEPVKAEPKKMRVKSTSSLVNVRETPNGNVLFRLQNQSPIVVEEEQGDWVKISGWVMKALVGER